MKPSQLLSLLQVAIENRLSVLVRGAPGAGKSDLVTQAAAAAGCDMILMHPAVSQPTDARGLPALVRVAGPGGTEETVAEFLPYGQLRALVSAATPTVCLIDDIGQASPAVQAAFMQLLLAREVGGHRVSDCVTFVAATNRREDRAGVSGILEPVKGRFATIVQLDPDADEWASWAAGAGLPPALGSFVQWRPGFLVGAPSPDIANTSSPRTLAHAGRWMLLGTDLRRGAVEGAADLERAAVEGAAGEAFATEYYAYLRRRANLPDARAALRDPAGLAVPVEPDVQAALCSLLAELVTARTFGNFVRCVTAVEREGGEEFGFLSMRMVRVRDPGLLRGRAYDDWCADHADALLGGPGAGAPAPVQLAAE